VVIRQRPSIGDALLLGPLIRCIKAKYPKSTLTVITDGLWMGGALMDVFEHLPGVDRVESVPALEWTTDRHKELEPALRGAIGDVPVSVQRANLIFDCNSGFIEFERSHNGHPPYGIGEFWVRHFDYDCDDYLPKYTVTQEEKTKAAEWVRQQGIDRPIVGIVLRAGHQARDWNFNGIADNICGWLHTSGYQPVTIDPVMATYQPHTKAFVGHQIRDVAAFLQQCLLVVTPDTGILHLAEAVGVPTVALWGIMNPELRLKGYNTTVIPSQSLGVCEEREQSSCQCTWKFQQWSCLRRLRPTMIVDALQETLNGIQRKQLNTCGHT
jgi:ADP-heptose:LPS heptosyltransferase